MQVCHHVYLLLLLPLCLARIPLIIDTDMDFDVNDLGALCLANILQDLGEVSLLAVVHNTGYSKAIGAVSVINHYFDSDSTLLGAFKGSFAANATHGHYIQELVDHWPSPVQDYSQVEEAVPILRQALATAEDRSVVIASIGFLTNLASLMSSPGDQYSDLTGRQLVKEKVRRLAVMGGYYPDSKDGEDGSEFNFDCGKNYLGPPLECYGSARKAISSIPGDVEVIFSGFEIGDTVMSGGAMTWCHDSSNPCRQAFIDTLGPGENVQSWDMIVVLMAVRGEGEVGCRKDGQGGVNWVGEGGENQWMDGTDSNQTYLVLETDPGLVGERIDRLLCLNKRREIGQEEFVRNEDQEDIEEEKKDEDKKEKEEEVKDEKEGEDEKEEQDKKHKKEQENEEDIS